MEALHDNIQKLKGFQEKYGSIDEYYQQYIIEETPSYKTLVKRLSQKGYGDKIAELAGALTTEYLRNVGYNMSKPDRHIRRILGVNHLGCSSRESAAIFEAMEIVQEIASRCGHSVAEVDYILWAYCADGYGEICTSRNPKCEGCPTSRFCGRGQ